MANKKEVEEKTTLDKLNSNLGSASEKIAANKNVITWCIVAVVAVAAFVIGYEFIYKNPHVNKGFEAYNEVEIKSAGNDSIAIDGLKKVAEQYGNTAAGQLASVEAGEKLYNEGKYEEALKYLADVKVNEPVLAANVKVLAGDCEVNLKKYDNALKFYDRAIKMAKKNPQIVPRVLLKEANVYDEQKKYDKALECYEQIKAEYPKFAAGASIDAYIAREKERLGN